MTHIILFPIKRHVGIERIAREIIAKIRGYDRRTEAIRARAERMRGRLIDYGLPGDLALKQANAFAKLLCRWVDHLEDEEQAGSGGAA